MVKLSVCLTTYNRANLLDRTLNSLSRQTRLPDELIISDDCSSDRTQDVVEKWSKYFPRVVSNRNQKNLYMPGNLNVAINLASGEYIANLHDADEFSPYLLEKWESVLDKFPNIGFVFNGVKFVTPHEEIVNLHDVDLVTKGLTFYEEYLKHKFSSIVWGTVIARKAHYEKLLPFRSEYGFYSDVDMWIRMCSVADVGYIKEPLMYLDESPTIERKFNWKKADITRRIQLDNINSFYADDKETHDAELKRHKEIVRAYYMRRLLGRIKRLDLSGMLEGFREIRRLHLLSAKNES